MQGAAVLERLVEASRLQSQGKMAAAAAVRASIPAGTEPKERSINKAAQALESMHPSPRTPSAERVGLWAPGSYIYGYYDPSLWGEDEDFKMYKDAKKYHYCAGLAVEDEAVRSGPLKIRRRMCGCPPCSPPPLQLRPVHV
jgi:hypothetical protein